MAEHTRRRRYQHDRVLIESDRILTPQFDDAVVYLSGAQLEMLRNVSQYLRNLTTYVSEYQPGYYLTPDASDYDDILEIVAELEEVLMGNPNTIWGFKDRVYHSLGGTKSGAGQYIQWIGGPGAGEVWVVQSVFIQNLTGARGQAILYVGAAPGDSVLASNPAPGLEAVVWTGEVVMEEGGNLHVTQDACLDGDVIEAAMVGYMMEVPT